MKRTSIAVLLLLAVGFLMGCNSQQVQPTAQQPAEQSLQHPKEATSAPETAAQAPPQQIADKLAPAWKGKFSYLGMRTGMTKQQAINALNVHRDMTLHCNLNEIKGEPMETCDGHENELSLFLTFTSGRLTHISATDKYSPFGAFTVPFLQQLGSPQKRTQTELEWMAGKAISSEGKTVTAESCKVYLYKGNANVSIGEWGVRRVS